VIGFYLLLAMNPQTPLGAGWISLTGGGLSFSFAGLVIASIVYSLPFMVQPLQSAFESVGRGPVEAAATLGASRLDAFFSVMLPQSSRGILTACVLTFAHTIGEFGVVLMVGGNIPDRTRTVSIAIYEHVESLEYGEAHILSAGLLIFSFVTLVTVYTLNRSYRLRVS
jgi:molybdate transport system permease protein